MKFIDNSETNSLNSNLSILKNNIAKMGNSDLKKK